MAFRHWFRRKPKSLSTSTMPTEPDHPLDGCFDCNICLDFARDPVVTLCGHLYCWPCIYKWFHIQSASSLASDEYPQCPVCKAEISHTTLVPLYGRGQTPSPSNTAQEEAKLPNGNGVAVATFVPPRPRPPACGTRALLAAAAASQPGHQLQYRNPYQGGQPPYQSPSYGDDEEDTVSSSLLLGGGRDRDRNRDRDRPVTNVLQPVAEMVGEMLYARMFGSSQSLYATPPNSYYLVGTSTSSARLRRQEMQAEKSLYRVSIFLLCCFSLCLILF
ncbi:hypothetical protein Dimus_035215 [Dionaea muscipula]